MKKMILLLMLIALPGAAFALEQSFTQQGLKITDQQKPDETISYEVNATVIDAGGTHGDHGSFSHHPGGGKWGWWGAGFMFIMMASMMILVL